MDFVTKEHFSKNNIFLIQILLKLKSPIYIYIHLQKQQLQRQLHQQQRQPVFMFSCYTIHLIKMQNENYVKMWTCFTVIINCSFKAIWYAIFMSGFLSIYHFLCDEFCFEALIRLLVLWSCTKIVWLYQSSLEKRFIKLMLHTESLKS